MKKDITKAPEAQLLDLLKKILPKATQDAQLAGRIYHAVELELKAKAKVTAFEKFGSQVSGEINVNRNARGEASEEQEITLKFVPFPVCLPGDKELVWLLAKRENMSPDEAGITLSKLEEEFWASKSGQKLIRDRVERNFPEFIARVSGGLLTEVGLKRHYKTPEPLKLLRTAPKR